MKKSLLILFSLALTINFSFSQTGSPVQDYIDKYKEIAIAEEIRTGVPASITLAQGILESAAGKSDLSLSSNNHFGIKCKSDWKGGSVFHDDDTKGECFRSYLSVEDSYRDHSDFLRLRPHYSFLFDLDVTDYEGWCNGLKKAGYATNPAYAQMLLKVIKDNDLQQYTLMAIQKVENWSDNIAVNPIEPDINNAGSTAVAANFVIETGPAAAGKAYPQGVFKNNQVKCIYVEAGASLFALAKREKVPFAKLLEYNDLDKNDDILTHGKLIYLEKKLKKSNSKEYHIVKTGETIETISQNEGVQLESIIEYNKIQQGLQPEIGEKVYLRPGNPSFYPRLVKIVAR